MHKRLSHWSLKDPSLGRILLVSTVVDGETEAWEKTILALGHLPQSLANCEV